MNGKKITAVLLTAFAVLLFLSSCEKDDSTKEYGTQLIYMPQSANVSLGLNAIYPVPSSSNNASPTGMNYLVDEATETTNVILGVALSGSAAGSYSVDITVNNDTIQQLLDNGTLGSNYVAMPASGYTLPARLDVSDKGHATFYLAVSNSLIVDPAYFGKHLVVAVQISNATRYSIDREKATTIVDLNIAGLFPSATATSEINVSEGLNVTFTGQNLDKVTALNLTGSDISLPIVSQSASSMVVTMPAMAAFNRGTVDLVTPFGTTQSGFELVNVDNAYKVFTDDYGANIGSNTDGDDYGSQQGRNTSVSKRGTASLAITYYGNNYSPGGLLNTAQFVNDGYQYITFWARSTTNGTGNEGIQMSLMGDGMPEGYGNDFAGVGIIVGPEWTYYKIAIGSSAAKPMWSKGSSFRKFGWRLNNWNVPNNEVVYFDDILFVK
ncbi:MAG: DUF1735 domain-containing protein [Candidatus Pseudobacter hemicellulosilyticus]|uniref:DUF1735 domain-containing protein n=1 Tax=Candidatus Pseudobacter hemicellulosilyticus TaxID=3121375 RepID=A0AAJ6BJI5_9BACT|nr:MAG: DUF1735 domain-containing protein [Pseudobacter sp.]